VPHGLIAGPAPQALFDDVRGRAERVADDAAQLVGGLAPVRVVVVSGSPAQVLTAASDDAELLVVGASSHHNVVTRVALGSIAQYCVNHAHCPVVVVPPSILQPSRADAEPALASV
jgi:nucleotide-binding universal stress UspA family protein